MVFTAHSGHLSTVKRTDGKARPGLSTETISLSDNRASVMGEYIDLGCRCLTAALEVKTISHIA